MVKYLIGSWLSINFFYMFTNIYANLLNKLWLCWCHHCNNACVHRSARHQSLFHDQTLFVYISMYWFDCCAYMVANQKPTFTHLMWRYCTARSVYYLQNEWKRIAIYKCIFTHGHYWLYISVYLEDFSLPIAETNNHLWVNMVVG